MTLDHGAPPIGADGQLWQSDERGIWRAMSVDRLAIEIGRTLTAFAQARKVNE